MAFILNYYLYKRVIYFYLEYVILLSLLLHFKVLFIDHVVNFQNCQRYEFNY
jgi:hypothetical protein